MAPWVRIAPQEWAEIRHVGESRQAYATRHRLASPVGISAGHALPHHVVGALGEFALAKYLETPWRHNVGVTTGADVGRNIEVRTRRQPGARDLILMRRDRPKEHCAFVLVHAYIPEDDLPLACLMGWMPGKQGMVRKYWQAADRYKPYGACFIPPECLREMGELKMKVTYR